MNITYAPPKLCRFITRIIQKIPLVRRYYNIKQNRKIYELAKGAAELNLPVRVVDSGWATQDCLTDETYRTLTRELLKIDRMSSSREGNVHTSLHWSRRYEYPYAIMKSTPSDHPSGDFRILDCGSGIGPIQFYLAMKGYKVYSLDLDLNTLERVAGFKSKMRLKTLYPVYGNVLDLPFSNNYFDSIVSISVLEHIVRPLKHDTYVVLKGFVNELLRVLKPKGLVVFTFDVNMNPQKRYRLQYDEYESLCEILGIPSKPPPLNRLCSSDTEEGRMVGEGLCVYCVTFTYGE